MEVEISKNNCPGIGESAQSSKEIMESIGTTIVHNMERLAQEKLR